METTAIDNATCVVRDGLENRLEDAKLHRPPNTIIAPIGSVTVMSSRYMMNDARRVLIAFSFIAMLLLLASLMVPTSAKAATHTKDVRGFVYDADYRKIPGASVSVTMLNPGNPVTKSEPSDSTGWFNIQFLAAEWDVGVTIRVVATYSSQQSDPNETTANDIIFQWCNATAFEFEIPQFGSAAGLLVTAGIIGVVAVTVLFWKRR